MVKKDSQSESRKQRPERKFSQEQYDILKRCSQKKDMTEWNNWREKHLHEKILLEKADFRYAHLENAWLNLANLEYANLLDAHLENANLGGANLQKANLIGINLENVNLGWAHLANANLNEAVLEGAVFRKTNLEGTNFSGAIVDGNTLVWDCKINRNTNFESVGLGSMRINPATRQLLEYNIRRVNWEQWYRGKSKKKWIVKLHQLLTMPVRCFWSISDYGLRTWRIILWFFGLSFVFAFAYFLWPNCIMVYGRVGEIRGFVHALYFSVVTMTTLGFGDIAANPDSWQGQVLLMVQVIFGYVLLGALVTRFAVLFTSGGPAGKFTDK